MIVARGEEYCDGYCIFVCASAAAQYALPWSEHQLFRPMSSGLDDATIERAIATRRRRRRRSSQVEEPNSRNAAIVGILLCVLGLLVGLALVSYSPHDQDNTDFSFRELLQIFRNNEEIRAKLDTTHNWLGLVGALIADFLIHDTFGYAAFLLLILPFLWAQDLFRYARVQHASLHTSTWVLICTVASAFWFGALRLIWQGISIEWSGLVGEFLASVGASIIGIAGAVVISSVGLFFAVVFATGISLVGLINRLRSGINALIAALQRHRRTKKAVIRTTAQESQPNKAEDDNPFTFLRKTAGQAVSNSEPRILTPEEPLAQSKNTPLGSADESSETARQRPHKLTFTVNSPKASLTGEGVDLLPKPLSGDETILYTPPSLELLAQSQEEQQINEDELKMNARLLQEKLETFKIKIENVTVIPGPVITQYEFVPAAGVKISQIEALADDIALALKARGIRIIAPIPGKGTVGVEIPNHKPSLVRFHSIVASRAFQEFHGALPLGLGKTITGDIYCTDLAELPHLLIAGATGSGKSVGINTIIISLLWRLHPRQLKFVIIDPKKVELTFYNKLKNHFLAVSPDVDEAVITSPANAVVVLKALVAEMEQRYDLLAKVGQRKISDYNQKLAEGKLKSSDELQLQPMPYIVVIIDELADLMMTARSEVEDSIIRLAQLARAVGIHLVVATQRPSVDVITGLIKANFPARIAYQVASKVDSRTIIDTVGAEQLLGNGDMLFTPGGQRPIRLQNSFITTEEVEAITDFIGNQRGYAAPYMLPSVSQSASRSGDVEGNYDPLFAEAARIVVHAQQGSTSLLQRRLRIGYSRAARIIDQLEMAGIVGPFDGSKARQVLIESDAELNMRLSELGL